MKRSETLSKDICRSMLILALTIAIGVGSATPSTACTSFSFQTDNGIFFGTNMDLHIGEGLLFVNRGGVAKEGYKKNSKGETLKWVSKYGSVTFNLAGRELAWGGMNEAGLVASTMSLTVTGFPAEDERLPVSGATWIQYILDTCGSVAEVMESDSLVRLAEDTCHFLVADEQGNCAVIEFLNGEFVCYTGETLPVKALANATYADCLTYFERGVLPEFNPGASAERVAAAATLTEGYNPDLGITEVEHTLGILTEVVVAPKRWWCDWFNEPYTRWSIAFDIGRGEIHFQTVANRKVRRLSLESFDFSCEAPVLMMDVNAKLDGAVDGDFVLYDGQWNLEVFTSFCDRYGIEVSEREAGELMGFLEGFECGI